jgi:MFS family permease
VAAALLAAAAGFGQFGAVSALGDVARDFGRVQDGATIADRAGLSGTELGVGLAVLHLASIGGLLLTGLADRFGRATLLLTCCTLGLVCTIGAAGAPGYWWFVAIFACGRPLLGATNALTAVTAAELTGSGDRAKAGALVAAGYGVGAGGIAVVHGLLGGTLGFRVTFALAVVPLAALPLIARRIDEPDRYTAASVAPDHPLPVIGAVKRPFRRRLLVVAVITFAVATVSGPANSFLFVYAESVRGMSGAAVAVMVAVAGLTGLGGLVLGARLADRRGRRVTTGAAIVAMVECGMLTYGGTRPALVVGYLAGMAAAATLGPAAGAFANELFPTSVRASVAGWVVAAGVLGSATGLVTFGAVADVSDRFGRAALITFLPALAAVALLAVLPETRGREPEELWPGATVL